MRVAFAGTPAFAALALQAILQAGFRVPLVLTQPDRPAGRGLQLTGSAVKKLAQDAGLALFQAPSLRDPGAQAQLRERAVDLLVVAAYGLILPPTILGWPRWGCLNIHASVLPRWRGAAPIQRALLAGDTSTGISIMQMDRGLDTGPVLRVEEVAIDPGETAGSLHDKLAVLGADLIVEVLQQYAAGNPPTAHAQTEVGATYANKLSAVDLRIDWSNSAEMILRQIHALTPAPGAVTELAGRQCKVWRAALACGHGEAGKVLAVGRDHLLVACGAGALRIDEIQPAGGKRLAMGAYLAGHPRQAGIRLDEV